jgi:UDP-3-O-[3-hydroxymyristoyl] N-acetylglucosamine deacetylase
VIPILQRTLKREVVIDGLGVHTGKRCSIKILPSVPNSGIQFRGEESWYNANIYSLGDSLSNTTLGEGRDKIETVEHLLSCFYGLFINNAIVEIKGNELPIGDGSASIFYDAIQEAGVEDQEDSARIGLVITKPFSIVNGNRYISIARSKELVIECSLDWHKNIIGAYVYKHVEGAYSEVARARTFADKKYVNGLRKQKKAQGTEFGVNTININDTESFERDECVKHKVLDILGDLSLLFGFSIKGKITACNSGHAMHHELVKGILNGYTLKRSN